MLAVVDVAQAVAWYVSVLGLVEHVRVGEGHRVQLGFDGERAELIVRELGDEERASDTTGQVMVRLDDVAGVLETARSNGADASDTEVGGNRGDRKRCLPVMPPCCQLDPGTPTVTEEATTEGRSRWRLSRTIAPGDLRTSDEVARQR